MRDALTSFDENGALVVASKPELLDDIRAFRWKRVFWHGREEFRACARVFVFGHALCEKALSPYIGMTAHALLAHVDAAFIDAPIAQQIGQVDELLARRILDRASFVTTRHLAPLPVLGIPGWWAANEQPAFYDNARYFRPGRSFSARMTDAARLRVT